MLRLLLSIAFFQYDIHRQVSITLDQSTNSDVSHLKDERIYSDKGYWLLCPVQSLNIENGWNFLLDCGVKNCCWPDSVLIGDVQDMSLGAWLILSLCQLFKLSSQCIKHPFFRRYFRIHSCCFIECRKRYDRSICMSAMVCIIFLNISLTICSTVSPVCRFSGGLPWHYIRL